MAYDKHAKVHDFKLDHEVLVRVHGYKIQRTLSNHQAQSALCRVEIPQRQTLQKKHSAFQGIFPAGFYNAASFLGRP